MTSLPIKLRRGAVPVVKPNDLVKIGQTIAQETPIHEYVIDLVKDLAVSPSQARKILLKKPGEDVFEGEVIAVNKTLLGLREEKLVSKVSGKFVRFERDSGKVIIETGVKTTPAKIISPVEGIVLMCNNDTIIIGTRNFVFQGIKGAGGDTAGEIFILNDTPPDDSAALTSEITKYYTLDFNAVNKIIVGREFSRDLLIKCIGMGVKGIIGERIDDEELEYINRRKLQVPVLEAGADTIKEIKKWKTKKIYMNAEEKTIIFLHL